MKGRPVRASAALAVVIASASVVHAEGLEAAVPTMSGGSQGLSVAVFPEELGPGSAPLAPPSPLAPAVIGTTFDGFGFDDNGTETGFLFIPADPMGAAGTDRVVAVTNVMIEARTKAGVLLWRDALKDFFSSLTPPNFLFDPKIVYDHYEGRFVVVALEKVEPGTANPDPGNTSRVLVAVSKTATPATATAADWWYTALPGKFTLTGVEYWSDYPGLEVDEEAVYITNNLFAFAPVAAGTYGGVRLWILDKGVAGGFYGGGSAAFTIHDPYGGGGVATTTMPCEVHGVGGVGLGIGTFLVSYSSLSPGGPGAVELVQVVRVDSPLGAVSFAQEYVSVGDIEDVGGIFGFPPLADAPQLGTSVDIEVNDTRALDCVWRSGDAWLTTTISPNAGPDIGQTTAHWFRLDTTSVPAPITLADQGDIGGEDIAATTFTFFPSVAVNSAGQAKFGFSASAASIYTGAYVAGREPGDAAGTVQGSLTVKAGIDYYNRPFGGPQNRWGDYSSISLDPTNDSIFWIFNKWADTRGTLISGEDGRWGTAWASCSFVPSSTTTTSTSTTTTTLPPGIGVSAKKLIVIDKLTAAGKAKVVFVAKDVAVTKGAGLSTSDISATFDFDYVNGATGGNFTIPAGASNGTDGWVVNKSTVAKYVNKAAPAGPTGAKVAVIKPAKVLKIVGKSLGDTAIDIFGQGAPGASGVDTEYTVVNAGQTNRHCTNFTGLDCTYKIIAGGTGAKLVCKPGSASTCP